MKLKYLNLFIRRMSIRSDYKIFYYNQNIKTMKFWTKCLYMIVQIYNMFLFFFIHIVQIVKTNLFFST